MRPPCDEAVIRSGSVRAPCGEQARLWILAATILGSSMAFIDSTVVNVALPALQTSFHATVVDVQWVVESYGLFLGALILVGGSLGDLFGRRRMFVAGVVIFALASASCGAASNINQLIIARSVQRCGGCASRTRQSCDHQRIFRRDEPRTGHWDVVRVYSYYGRNWARSWGLAC